MTGKNMKIRSFLGCCVLVTCLDVNAFQWWASSSSNGRYTMIDEITMSGGVTRDRCIWSNDQTGNYRQGIYAEQAGDNAFVKLAADLDHLRPKNCDEAVTMLNSASIWNTKMYRGSVYRYDETAVPPNQVRITLWMSPSNKGQYAYFYYDVAPSLSPPRPASCSTYQVASIDFGTVDPQEISGKKATSRVVVSCDKKASVRVRFMTREGLSIFQMDNGLTTYLKIDDNPGTAGSYQTVAENASSPARAFNLSAELLGTSGSVKPGAFSYTAVVRVDIL
ncbi:MrpH family fimbial adhesin [Serratia quinivorans]